MPTPRVIRSTRRLHIPGPNTLQHSQNHRRTNLRLQQRTPLRPQEPQPTQQRIILQQHTHLQRPMPPHRPRRTQPRRTIRTRNIYHDQLSRDQNRKHSYPRKRQPTSKLQTIQTRLQQPKRTLRRTPTQRTPQQFHHNRRIMPIRQNEQRRIKTL